MERVKGNWRECVRVLVAAHTLGYTCVWIHCDTRAHTQIGRPQGSFTLRDTILVVRLS